MRVRQKFLEPGFYGDPTTGLRELTADDLAKFHRDTNAALKSGLPVPLLDEHCEPDALDGSEAESVRTRGWLKRLVSNKDGSLSHETEVSDPDVQEKIKRKEIKFVSPQLNPEFSKNGKHFGSIVRHLALTPKPIADEQGAMEVLALSESDAKKPFVVSLNSFKGATMPKKKPDPETTQLAEKPEEEISPESPNADVLPTNDVETEEPGSKGVDNESLVAQIVEKFGVILPDGVDANSKAGMALILTAILNAGGNDESEELPMEPIEEESPDIAQFSEREKAMFGRLEALEKREKARDTQQRRAGLNLTLAGAGLPPALTKRLKQSASSVQFSEGGDEKPHLTIAQVVALVKDTFPPSVLQLAEGQTVEEATTEETHPEGDDFYKGADGRNPVTQQEAAQLAAEGAPKKFGHLPKGEVTEVSHDTTRSPAQAPGKKRGRPKGSKTKK